MLPARCHERRVRECQGWAPCKHARLCRSAGVYMCAWIVMQWLSACSRWLLRGSSRLPVCKEVSLLERPCYRPCCPARGRLHVEVVQRLLKRPDGVLWRWWRCTRGVVCPRSSRVNHVVAAGEVPPLHGKTPTKKRARMIRRRQHVSRQCCGQRGSQQQRSNPA
jgi:hypothetical protein